MMKRATALRIGATLSMAGSFGLPAFAADPVKIQTSAVDSAAEPFYAYDGGFFKAAGLDVELGPASANGAAISSAVAGGAVDVGMSNLVSIALAHARNIPFVAIGPGGLYTAKTPSTLLIVPTGSSVKTAADLNGKVVGVNTLRGLPQYGTQAWIDKHGGNSASVKFTEVPPLDQLTALKAGRIDAGAFVEPYAAAARKDGTVIGAPFDAIAASFLITVLFSTREWAEKNKDTVRRIQEAMAKTAVWANKEHDKTGAILMKYAKLQPETLQTMQRTIFAEHIDTALVQPVIDMTAKYGGIGPFNASEIVFKA